MKLLPLCKSIFGFTGVFLVFSYLLVISAMHRHFVMDQIYYWIMGFASLLSVVVIYGIQRHFKVNIVKTYPKLSVLTMMLCAVFIMLSVVGLFRGNFYGSILFGAATAIFLWVGFSLLFNPKLLNEMAYFYTLSIMKIALIGSVSAKISMGLMYLLYGEIGEKMLFLYLFLMGLLFLTLLFFLFYPFKNLRWRYGTWIFCLFLSILP